MNLILTMAGKYQRFIDEGYRIPKFLLPWGEKTILETIIFELNRESTFDNIFLVANSRDELFMPHVRKVLNKINIPKSNLILIDDTPGQVHTAYEALKRIKYFDKHINSPVFFHNIDTILYKRKFENIRECFNDNDGFIDVFKSNNHTYSYVLIDKGYVQSIEEKILISNLSTSGLYGFSSSKLFLSYFDESDSYISELYKRIINDKGKIITSKPHTEKETLVLGTPSAYLSSAHMLDIL